MNVGEEPQKHGFLPDEVPAAVDEVVAIGVDLRGLMTIPPLGEPAGPFFDRVAALRDSLLARHPRVCEISAGMTDDFEQAIRAGATTIRVGRAIFE